VIGLTSDFIPKAVFMYVYSDDNSLKGYVNFTLSSESDAKKRGYAFHAIEVNSVFVFVGYLHTQSDIH
jgi:hypothetical protein